MTYPQGADLTFVHKSEGGQCNDCKNAFTRKTKFCTPAERVRERATLDQQCKTEEGQAAWRDGDLQAYLNDKADNGGRAPAMEKTVNASKSSAWVAEEFGPSHFTASAWKVVFGKEPHPDMIKEHVLPGIGYDTCVIT